MNMNAKKLYFYSILFNFDQLELQNKKLISQN